MQTNLNKKVLIKFFAFLVLGILIQFITRMAPTPENSKSLWFALPAFLVFVFFVLSMVSWGGFFRSKISYTFFSGPEEAMFDLGAGSVFLYVIAYALTPLGLFSSVNNPALWLILALGFSLGSISLQPKKWLDFGSDWLSRSLMALIPIIVVLKLIEGIQFHQHGDSYVTYLPGPRIWGASGSFESFRTFTQLFLSTSWESLFAWGTALMGFQGGVGLDISQWFSQWVSGGIGVFGVLITCLAFCKRMEKAFLLPSRWFPIIAISALQISAFRWAQNLAKNDHGIAFWGMAAFYASLYLAPISAGFAFFTGALAGAAAVGKFTLAIIGCCIGLVILLHSRKQVFSFILGGFAGALPVFLRNYFLTKNPVFPWLPKVFPSEYLSEFAANGSSAATEKAFHLVDIPMYAQELFWQSPLILSVVVMLLIKKYSKSTFNLVIFPIISYVLFTVTVRPSTGIRYQGPTLFLLVLFGAYFAFFLLNLVADQFIKSKKDWALGFASLAVLATSSITFFTFFQIGKSSKFNTYSQVMPKMNQVGGPAKLWIRQNISPSHSILSFGDVHIYYLIDYPLTEVGESVEYGKKIFRSTLDSAEQVFKTAPFDYLYLAGDDYYKDAAFAKDQAQIADIMVRTNQWNQNCKRFDDTRAQVWDLKCLKN